MPVFLSLALPYAGFQPLNSEHDYCHGHSSLTIQLAGDCRSSGLFAADRTAGAIERLARAKAILEEHGNDSWLTENGSLVMLNNGIEFAAAYFILLLTLLLTGSGKASVDYFIYKRYMN